MIEWAWRASGDLDPDWKLRSKFVLAALRHPASARKLKDLHPNSALGQLVEEWPDTVGFQLWPYQCAAWDASTRFARIEDHLRSAEALGLSLSPDEKLVLADLGEISPGASLILDRAKWLSREGHLTLSLFKNDFRAFTTSFSLSKHPQTEIFVGGLQGRQDGTILDLYRDLTKDFHGIRPRDFMIEAMRLFANRIGAQRLFAVADQFKISRHAYFGAKGAAGLFYDEIWQERGGVKVDEAHFELPIEGTRRSLDDVPAKKRAMYRRRYEMLDRIEALLPRDFSGAERRHFDAT